MKNYRVLSIDGGGVRGIIPAIWLNRLESLLDDPVVNHFDLIAGTSTGSILACGIALGHSTDDMIDLYRRKTSDAFPREERRLAARARKLFTQGISNPRYDGKGLEAVLREVFGDLTFGALQKPTMVLAYNLLNRRPVVFKSWNPEHQGFPLWEVCKASCSAPTYFPAHLMRMGAADLPLTDGGVVATNPSALALAEAVALRNPPHASPQLSDLIVASFGTGLSTRHISVENARQWGALEWAGPIIDVVFDGSSHAASYVCENLLGENHFRFQTRLIHADDDLDDTQEPNLNALASLAQNYLDHRGGNELMMRLVGELGVEPSGPYCKAPSHAEAPNPDVTD